MSLAFLKMNGAGNDFVIFDAREQPLRFNSQQVRHIADRRNPLTRGCDQLIVIESSPDADAFMRIYNADGGEVDACGNATRCIGWIVMEENHSATATVQTNVDILHCSKNTFGAGLPGWKNASGLITADMGMPRFEWQTIPLSHPADTLHVPLETEGLRDPVCLSMGNPHAVFFVDNPEQLNRIEKIGAQLQRHPLFPKGVNVSIAHVAGNAMSGNILTRVWERGVGLTASCGTAACAVKIAAVRRSLLAAGKYHTLTLQNQEETQQLMVRWDDVSQHVFLHGPVKLDFEGEIEV